MGRLILADSSAWIEYLRATESETDKRLDNLLRDRARVATTDLVLLEIFGGARDKAHHQELQRLLYGREYLRTYGPSDFEAGARIYRICRKGGNTIRKLSDCVIAAVAMRCGAAVLARDGDFTAIARHVELELA
ncbi:MAG TPA: PIN domain nuclease [Conexibacter sp.]|nr:PIN domain nuclease [Conexibacter sp.]